MWRYTAVVPALGRWRQKNQESKEGYPCLDSEFKPSLGYKGPFSKYKQTRLGSGGSRGVYLQSLHTTEIVAGKLDELEGSLGYIARPGLS